MSIHIIQPVIVQFFHQHIYTNYKYTILNFTTRKIYTFACDSGGLPSAHTLITNTLSLTTDKMCTSACDSADLLSAHTLTTYTLHSTLIKLTPVTVLFLHHHIPEL